MPRSPGLPKTGGRKKGTPNRRTDEFHETLERHGVNVPEKLAELLPILSPETQADVLLNLLQYLYPKRKASEHLREESSGSEATVIILPSNGRELPEFCDGYKKG